MNLFDWITWPARLRRRRPKPIFTGKLRCEECGGGIHRHDHYMIIAARHRNCKDPRLVGQQSLRLELHQTPQGHDPELRFVGLACEPELADRQEVKN